MTNEINQEIRNEEGNLGRNAVDRVSLRDEMRFIEKGRATSLWYNPATDRQSTNGILVEPMTVYKGETPGMLPTWETPVFDMAAYIRNSRMLKSGATNDVYKVLEDPYIDDYQDIAREYADQLNEGRRMKSAAVGTDADFSAIDVVNVMAEMVATELRTFVLEQALTVIGTPQLDLKVDTYTRFTAQQGVPEGVAPVPKRANVSRTSYDLTKDVSLIGITDEAQLRTVHDMYKQQVDTAVTDFKRLKSNKIATQLSTANATAANVGGSATTWLVVGSTGLNTVDPRQDIGALSDIIFANNGAPNILATADRTWRAFVSNTFIRGILQAIPQPDMSMAKVINSVPGLPGFTWYVDNEMTNTTMAVFDRKAVALLQGPVRTAQYRLEIEGIDGYIYRDWNLPIFLVSNRVQLLTGVD